MTTTKVPREFWERVKNEISKWPAPYDPNNENIFILGAIWQFNQGQESLIAEREISGRLKEDNDIKFNHIMDLGSKLQQERDAHTKTKNDLEDLKAIYEGLCK